MNAEQKRTKRAAYMRNYYATTDYALYVCHRHFMDRCYDEKCKNFDIYGARGITVCSEWRADSKAFIQWAKAHGWVRGMQIDRINVNGNYEPANCRFVTSSENNRNRRNNKLTEDKVVTIRHMLSEGFTTVFVAEKFGVHHSLIGRIKNNKIWI